MGRPLRAAAGGSGYHVLNRANARIPIFEKPEDYEAFERILAEAVARVKMRLLAYCLVGKRWKRWEKVSGTVFPGFLACKTLGHPLSPVFTAKGLATAHAMRLIGF
jgi:hypothetical protein